MPLSTHIIWTVTMPEGAYDELVSPLLRRVAFPP